MKNINKMICRSSFQDYRAPGFYRVTITMHERRLWFGVCENNSCRLNLDGWLVYELWHRIQSDYSAIQVSTLYIMPGHLHGILRVTGHCAHIAEAS